MRAIILIVAGMMVAVATAGPISTQVHEAFDETTEPVLQQLPAELQGPLGGALDTFWLTVESAEEDVWGEVDDIVDLLQSSMACVRGSAPLHVNQASTLDIDQRGTDAVFVGAFARLLGYDPALPQPGAYLPSVQKIGFEVGINTLCSSYDRPNPSCDYATGEGCRQSDYFESGSNDLCSADQSNCAAYPGTDMVAKYPFMLVNFENPRDNDLQQWLNYR